MPNERKVARFSVTKGASPYLLVTFPRSQMLGSKKSIINLSVFAFPTIGNMTLSVIDLIFFKISSQAIYLSPIKIGCISLSSF